MSGNIILETFMTVVQSILLGILQGIAEFLPISSSGHLAVAQKLFGLDEVPLLFDVLLHISTLAAVVLYFRKTIAELFCILFRWIARKPAEHNPTKSEEKTANLLAATDEIGRKTILAVLFATIVTGVIGIFTSKLIPELPIQFTCAGFIVTAFFLIFSSVYEKKRQNRTEQNNTGVSIKQSLFIGFMQGIGTLPGISRSGSTIAGAQIAGVSRNTAGEFSFIVSIPAIIAAFLLELKDLHKVGESIGAAAVLCGCAAAFVCGYIALSVLMKLIKKGKLEWFACYLIPLGLLGFIFF